METKTCPVCGFPYEKGSSNPCRKSRHHIFPRRWYPGSTTTVDVCQKCHDEFHCKFPFTVSHKWTRRECVLFWILFCEMKDFDYFKEYRILRDLI